MENILYITTQDIGISEGIGIKNKIFSQLESYLKKGIETKLIAFDNGNIIKIENNEKNEIIKYSKEFKSKRLGLYKVVKELIKEEKLEYIYIRYFFSDPMLIRMLKQCNKYCKRILVEIPTYPYNGELPKNKKGTIIKIIDEIYSQKLKKYVDNIITFSEDKEIFGITTINIENGVNLNSIPERKINIRPNELRLIGVANLSFWHGFDRIIEGLNEYYKQNRDIKVYFDIIGDGSEKNKLENLVLNYKLDEYIRFKGIMRGKELDSLFNEADIAVGSLGIHRLGLESVSTLKSKEYFARGIPFIYSYNEKFIGDNERKYVFKIDANDSYINIDTLIQYYKNIKNINRLSNEMRSFAKSYLTWDYQIEKIITKILK